MRRHFFFVLIGISVLILIPGQTTHGEEAEVPKFHVKGAGFFKDRLLIRQLENLFQPDGPHFTPNDVEDAALLVISEMQSDGYLEASVVPVH